MDKLDKTKQKIYSYLHNNEMSITANGYRLVMWQNFDNQLYWIVSHNRQGSKISGVYKNRDMGILEGIECFAKYIGDANIRRG